MTGELSQQVETLIGRGYPAAAGLDADGFRRAVEPLEERVPDAPFTLVVRGVAADRAIGLLDGGFTTMDADDLARFEPFDGVEVPAGPAYLLVDPDTGAETLDVTPDDALGRIGHAGRSPLTIEEGLALVAQDPRILRDRNCFSMLGSRCGDRRVTALWVSGGRPRLGWCWAGNPHSWLGSASCSVRIGAG